MDLEKLIELVKEHYFLFDYNDKGYHDMPKKDMVWRSIGKKLGQNPEECKKQWTTLRDGFRRHLRKRKKRNIIGAPNPKKWRYEDEMTFLLPFMQKRTKPSSTNNISIKIEDDEQPENISQTSEMINDNSGEETNDCQLSDKIKNKGTKSVPIRRKFMRSKPTNTTTLLLKYLLEKKNEKQDETEALFYSLAQTVKKMDPYHRSLAKTKVCSIVGELELQSLSHQSPPVKLEAMSCNSPSLSLENVSMPVPSPALSSSGTNEEVNTKHIVIEADFHGDNVDGNTASSEYV